MVDSMYKMKPIFTPDKQIELPTCMYHLKNLHCATGSAIGVAHATNGPAVLHQNERQSSPTEIAKLEAVQEDILSKLTNLKSKLDELRKMVKEPVVKPSNSSAVFSSSDCEVGKLSEVVVKSSVSSPPYGLLALKNAWAPGINVSITCHTLSSLKSKVPDDLRKVFTSSAPVDSNVPTLHVRVIWADVSQLEVVISPATQVIKGEANLLRLLSRYGPSHFNIDAMSAEEAAAADALLDVLYGVLSGSLPKNSAASLTNKLAPAPSGWLLSHGPGIADIALWSYLKSDKSAKCPPKLNVWHKNCDKIFKQ